MNTFIKNNSLLLGTPKPQFTYDPNKLVLVYDTSKEPANNTISVPVNGVLNITIDWGDNTSDVYTTNGWKTHTYSLPGIYVVQVSGFMSQLSFGTGLDDTNNKRKLVRCLSFGNIGLTSLPNAFRRCTNFIEAPKVLPNTVNNISGMFFYCVNFNQNINSWNTSNVTTMGSTFYQCSSFNQPLNSWDVSQVTNMSSLFEGASIFNQNINSWNTSNVTNFVSMFRLASSYNQPMNSWDTSKATNMASMFVGATNFNNNISSWNTSNVTNMSNMFYNCVNFNQNLSNWNVSKVLDMNTMFYNCDNFTSNLGSWDLSSFNSAGSLNNFMSQATGMNTADYDATLIGWNNNKASFRNDLKPSFGGSKYSSAASAARAALIAYGWIITDGGLA